LKKIIIEAANSNAAAAAYSQVAVYSQVAHCMYDHILSSDEFLIRMSDTLQDILTEHGLHSNQNNILYPTEDTKTPQTNEQSEEREDTAHFIPPHTIGSIQEINETLHRQNTNAITLFNCITQIVRQIHDDILQQKAQHKKKTAKAQQTEMIRITKQLKRRNTPAQAEALRNRYTDIQQEIKN